MESARPKAFAGEENSGVWANPFRRAEFPAFLVQMTHQVAARSPTW